MTRKVSLQKYFQHRHSQRRTHKNISPYISLSGLVLLLSFLLTGCIGSVDQPADISGSITITGSTALLPLVTAAQQAYQQQHPQTHIQVGGGGSLTGLQDVTKNRSDVGDSDIYADPGTFPDPNLTDHIVCVTPFVMIVNKDVRINSLTRQQIIDIYNTGKYTDWSQLDGGPSLPIKAIVRPNSSGTRVTFRKYILNGLDEKGSIKLQVDDTKKVVNMVAQTPGAIGYVALSAVTPAVKYIAIDGYAPTNANITSGHYNFWSYEHMYTLNNDNPLVNDFLSYMTSDAMQATVKNLHYIPINDMNLPKLALENGGQSGSTPGSRSHISILAQGKEAIEHELL